MGTPAVTWYPAVGKGWKHQEQMEGKHCVYLDFLLMRSSFGSDGSSLKMLPANLSSFSELYLLQRNCCGLGKSLHHGVFPSHPQLVLATLATASMDLESV